MLIMAFIMIPTPPPGQMIISKKKIVKFIWINIYDSASYVKNDLVID